MSTPEDDAIISMAEQIARMTAGEVNIEEYQALLFQIGAMLSIWRAVMTGAGYSDTFVEKSAWLMLTSFYGHHLTTTEISL